MVIIPALIIALLSLHLAIVWRQKHTQFAGPGRTERNVVGSRLWPTYAMRSVELTAVVIGTLSALGGLVQIIRSGSIDPMNPPLHPPRSFARATGPVARRSVAVPAFYAVLFFGGGQDVIAPKFHLQLGTVRPVLQIMLLALPVLSAIIAHRVCRDLAHEERDRIDGRI